MSKAINQIVQSLQQVIEAIIKFVLYVWTWSFGQIIAVFQSDWQSLPIWKLAILTIVVLAIAFLLYKSAIRLWKAAEDIIHAFIALLTVMVQLLPFLVAAGLIAAAGGYMINHVKF
jgi:type VI protein secretion system component VasF